MNAILWFVTWIITSLIPTSHTFATSKLRHFLALIFGAIFGFVAIATCTIDAYHIWYLIGVKLIMSLMEWFFSIDAENSRSHRYRRTYGYGRDADEEGKLSKRFNVNFKNVYRNLFILGLLVLIIGSAVLVWQTFVAKGVANASTFDQTIEFMAEGTPLFENEIADDMLRLTTDELARSIVQRNIAHFGSDVLILSNHITKLDGRLVWVATIGRAKWADNQVKGFVIIDANNPEVEPEIINIKFNVGESLLYVPPFHYGGIQGNAYYGINTANAYGRAYLTQDLDREWKYVLTTVTVNQWSFVEKANGVYVFGKHGLETYYSMDELPSWITQPYDEDWMESQVNMFGASKRGDSFDIWASGLPWKAPSNDRLEMSEDTRFIISPDTNDIVALINVDPIGPIETIAGTFKFSRDGIQYYNLRHHNIMAGHQAENAIESHILKPTTGEYQARMPLLYPINDTYAWFVPIYWEGTHHADSTHDTIRLAGLGIVEANDLDHLAMVMTSEGYKGASLVAEAKRRFLDGEVTPPEPEEEIPISGTLEYMFDYTDNGNTVYVLTINGTEYVAYTQRFDFHVISQIEKLEVGSEVSVFVNEDYEFLGFQ